MPTGPPFWASGEGGAYIEPANNDREFAMIASSNNNPWETVTAGDPVGARQGRGIRKSCATVPLPRTEVIGVFCEACGAACWAGGSARAGQVAVRGGAGAAGTLRGELGREE